MFENHVHKYLLDRNDLMQPADHSPLITARWLQPADYGLLKWFIQQAGNQRAVIII